MIFIEKRKLKNKSIWILFSFLLFFLIIGFHSARAQWDPPKEGDQCGTNGSGTCKSGTFSCPSGWTAFGEKCSSSLRCCIKEKDDAGLGGSCGKGDEGTCLPGSATCPDNYSRLWGGNSCTSGYVCCTRDSSNEEEEEEEEDKKDKDPLDGAEEKSGNGDSSGVKLLGQIYIPEDSGLPNNNIQGVLSNVLTWLLGIVGILGLMGFVISGIQYLLAYSNEELAESAKRNMTYSAIGITVALAGFIIIQAINLALQGNPWF